MARARVLRGRDGKWHGWLDLGCDPETRKRRRLHVSHAIEDVAQRRLDQLTWQLARYGRDFVVIPKFLTAEQWFERWLLLEVRLDRRPGIARKHTEQVRLWIKPWLSGQRLSKVTQAQLVQLLDAIPTLQDKLDCLATLRESLSSAVRGGYLTEDVAWGIEVVPAVARSIYEEHFTNGLPHPCDPGRVVALQKRRRESRLRA